MKGPEIVCSSPHFELTSRIASFCVNSRSIIKLLIIEVGMSSNNDIIMIAPTLKKMLFFNGRIMSFG